MNNQQIYDVLNPLGAWDSTKLYKAQVLYTQVVPLPAYVSCPLVTYGGSLYFATGFDANDNPLQPTIGVIPSQDPAWLLWNISGGQGGYPTITSPTRTILVTGTAANPFLDLPQSIDPTANPSFAGLTLTYNATQQSTLKKMLNFFIKTNVDVGVLYTASIRTATLTGNRTVTIPDANSVTVVPATAQAGKVLQYIGADGIQIFVNNGGGLANILVSDNITTVPATSIKFIGSTVSADLTDPSKAIVTTVGGGTVLSSILEPLQSTDATTFQPNSVEGVGNTIIYINGDATAILTVGTFVGFALTDPYAYLISSSTVTTVAPIVTTITLSSPLRAILLQSAFIYKYRIDGSAVQKIVLDPSYLVANDNNTLYIQSKYTTLYGTTVPNIDTFGFLGQIYAQDTSTEGVSSANIWVCLTTNEQTPFTWVAISGGSGGIVAITSTDSTLTVTPNGTTVDLIVAPQGATTGQVYTYNGTKWVPANLPTPTPSVTSLKANTGTARTGNLALLNGTNTNIVDNGDNTFTVNSTGSGGSNTIIATIDPTTTTVAIVGQLYYNSITLQTFICTAITSGTPATYTWALITGITANTVAPTTTTVGYVGELYIYNNSNVFTYFICVAKTNNIYTWNALTGSSGVGATFGSTSVVVANFRNYTTQPNGDTWIPTDSPNRLFGAALMGFGVTTNQYSEGTGFGIINGVRYIDSVRDYDVNRGNGLIFPQSLTPKSHLNFRFTNNIFKFNCVFNTPLTNAGVQVEFIIASASVIGALQNPTNNPIAFFNGGQGDEQVEWITLPVATVVNTGATSTVTITGGEGYLKGDFRLDPNTGQIVNYVGSNDPYYLFVVVSDKSSGTNSCTSMSSIVMSPDRTICSYAMDMFIGLQGNGGGSGGGGTITSNSLTVTNPTATSTEIEVPSGKTLVKYITQPTSGKAVQYIDLLGNIYLINTNDTTVATTDPTNATVGNQGDSILNTANNNAMWIQITPTVTPQTYNWVRVNTPLQLLSGLPLPTSAQGNNGDLYLKYYQDATPYIVFQKQGNQWVSSSFFSNNSQNNTLQLIEQLTLSDLRDVDLYPNFNQTAVIANIINVANTTTILSYITLYVSVITTGVTDANVGTLLTNIIPGQILSADGAGAIGSWEFIITSFSSSGTGVDNKTTTINGHLKPSDNTSLATLNAVSGAVKTDTSWRFIGQGLFTDCYLPDLTKTILGIVPNTNKIGLVNIPAATSNIQTFRTSANSVGALITVPFNTAVISLGTSFGSMNNGVFTFNRAVICTVNVVLNVSSDPDGWGTINGVWTNTRYNQYSGTSTKGAFSQKISFASGDTYAWRPNNSVTVYGTGGTNTFIEFQALN